MPHLPDSQHPDHDLELIAAYAAGDATGPELERATALLAACEDCAALHHDLRSIAAAMPTAIPPRASPFHRPSTRERLSRESVAKKPSTTSGRTSWATETATGETARIAAAMSPDRTVPSRAPRR